LSYEQLNKRKQQPGTTVSIPGKPSVASKSLEKRPSSSAPQTGLNDIKKSVQSDRKSPLAVDPKRKPTEQISVNLPGRKNILKNEEIDE
jgi:hypothetical protein